jgi:hypothetical protein
MLHKDDQHLELRIYKKLQVLLPKVLTLLKISSLVDIIRFREFIIYLNFDTMQPRNDMKELQGNNHDLNPIVS